MERISTHEEYITQILINVRTYLLNLYKVSELFDGCVYVVGHLHLLRLRSKLI